MAKILSFEQWKQRVSSQTNDEEIIKCPACDGDGEIDHECDCRHCETEFEHCDACDGNGEAKFGDLKRWHSEELFRIENYLKEAVRDLEALSAWLGDYGVLADSGFTPFSQYDPTHEWRHKKLVYNTPHGRHHA